MAIIDLSGYAMVARQSGRGLWITMQPATQGRVAVDDTIILREGESYRVTALDKPYSTRRGAQEVRVSLEPTDR